MPRLYCGTFNVSIASPETEFPYPFVLNRVTEEGVFKSGHFDSTLERVCPLVVFFGAGKFCTCLTTF